MNLILFSHSKYDKRSTWITFRFGYHTYCTFNWLLESVIQLTFVYLKDMFNCKDLIMLFSDSAHLASTNNYYFMAMKDFHKLHPCEFLPRPMYAWDVRKEITRFTYFIHGVRVSVKVLKCIPTNVATNARGLGHSDQADNRDGTY